MMKHPVIVTDLDGTLLDHHTYSYEAAKPAIRWILEQGYPLIINSSKTRAEILALQQQLNIQQPFICENGAAIYWPVEDLDGSHQWSRKAFAAEREQWWPQIDQLRREHAYQFNGFGDWSDEQLAEQTGLSVANAALAGKREFTEPLLWSDSDTRLQSFKQEVALLGLRLVQGGRFLSLQGGFDKRDAMQWLREHYRDSKDEAITLIALGDSPNDLLMLEESDIAVVIKSAKSSSLTVAKPAKIIRTSLPGPAGWKQAMSEIFQQKF